MSESISINDAAARGISKLRMPQWRVPGDHIEIHITRDKLLGPWVTFRSGMAATAQKIFITEFNCDTKEWLPWQAFNPGARGLRGGHAVTDYERAKIRLRAFELVKGYGPPPAEGEFHKPLNFPGQCELALQLAEWAIKAETRDDDDDACD